MDFDLKKGTSRLEKENQKRNEDAKKKLKLQKESEEAARRAREALVAAELARNEEILRKQLEEEMKTPRTPSEKISSNLIPYLIEDENINDDKVIISPSQIGKLNLESLDPGSIITLRIRATISRPNSIGGVTHVTKEMDSKFNKSSRGGGGAGRDMDVEIGEDEKVTHCGLREFSASEGTIGITQKILDSIQFGLNISSIRSISLERIPLRMGTYAKLQPLKNSFNVISDVKLCLEDNLRYHVTLTEGDMLHVWYRGEQHYVKVLELKPKNYVRVNNSDIEIDLDNSEEYYRLEEEKKLRNLHSESNVSNSNSSSNNSSSSNSSNSNNSSNNNSSNNSNSSNSNSNSTSVQPAAVSVFSGVGHKLRADNTSASSATTIAPSPVSGNGLQLAASYASPSSSSNSSSAIIEFKKTEPIQGSENNCVIKMKIQGADTVARRFSRTDPISDIFMFLGDRFQLTLDRLASVRISFGFPIKEITYDASTCLESISSFGIISSQEMIRVSL